MCTICEHDKQWAEWCSSLSIEPLENNDALKDENSVKDDPWKACPFELSYWYQKEVEEEKKTRSFFLIEELVDFLVKKAWVVTRRQKINVMLQGVRLA